MDRFVRFAILFAWVPAFGQTAVFEQGIRDCAKIENDAARLECYDLIANLAPPSEITMPDTGGTGDWIVSDDTNPLDDTRTVTLILGAESGKSRWGNQVALVIRCRSGKTELYINWQDYLGSEARVTIRVGKASATRANWSISSDSKATFYPRNDVRFIKELLLVDKFVAQVTPYSESPVTAIFDLSGMREAIKPLRETCGW